MVRFICGRIQTVRFLAHLRKRLNTSHTDNLLGAFFSNRTKSLTDLKEFIVTNDNDAQTMSQEGVWADHLQVRRPANNVFISFNQSPKDCSSFRVSGNSCLDSTIRRCQALPQRFGVLEAIW